MSLTIAVMQPYFMPYVGYFQLANAVDRFVFLDDVNFIKKGWINRNRILDNRSDALFSIPLTGASQNRKINEIPIAYDERWQRKFFATLDRNYKEARYLHETTQLLRDLLNREHQSIGDLAKASIKMVADLVGLPTQFVESSAIYSNTELKGQDRIIDICLAEKADVYINPQNGRELYDKSTFAENGIKLLFSEAVLNEYDQQQEQFLPGLSIIDMMMFISPEAIREQMTGKIVE